MNNIFNIIKTKRVTINHRYILIAACILIVVGYLLMTGLGDSDIFSPRRIVLAPLLCLAGYLLIIIGILLLP